MTLKEGYQLYLQSEHWRKYRKFVLQHYGYKCQRCSQRAASVHHKNYNCLNKETLQDVEALCRECHSKVHGKPYNPNEKKFKHPRKSKGGLKFELVIPSALKKL